MSRRTTKIILGICTLFLCSISLLTSREQQAPLIPLTLLFADEASGSPSLSPDGKQIAFLAPYNGVTNIWVRPVDTASGARAVTNDSGRGIFHYWWAYDNESLFYMQNNNGNENSNIYRTVIATGQVTNLTPFPDVQVRHIRSSKKFLNLMLISMNKEDKRRRDVYLLDITTGGLTLVAKNPGNNIGWGADRDLQVCLSWILHDDGSTTLFHRFADDAPWQEVLQHSVEVVQGHACVGSNGQEVYCLDASETDKARLVKINTQTKEKIVLACDDCYDISSALLMHPQTYEPVCTAIQRVEWDIVVLDNAYAQDIAFLKRELGNTLNIVSYDASFNLWIVRSSASNLPSEYYVYSRATQKLSFLFSTQSELRTYTLAKTEPISYFARDGLCIHGYITYPTTTSSRKDLPVVVWVHGGPWERNTMSDCDAIVQLLANRGYVCLQLNYRGSIGYGKSFVKAGYKEFGKAMQHDVTDGVSWLIEQGIADAKRIAILGGSYGGYAALCGAAFTPDLYCCAVDLCGMSSLITFIKSIPPYWKPLLAKINVQIGNIDTERAMLEERSPLLSASKIRIPVLIGQGANDPRVMQAESEQMVAALKERGIPCEYLLFKNEGHGLAYPANRIKFYRAMERFLARYLGGRCEE